jgi:large subunit ribosomal protein L15
MLKLPKRRGFGSLSPKPEVVGIGTLARVFQDGATITPKILRAKGLVRKTKNGVKILGGKGLQMKFIVKGCTASAGAKAQIEQAGGSVV